MLLHFGQHDLLVYPGRFRLILNRLQVYAAHFAHRSLARFRRGRFDLCPVIAQLALGLGKINRPQTAFMLLALALDQSIRCLP